MEGQDSYILLSDCAYNIQILPNTLQDNDKETFYERPSNTHSTHMFIMDQQFIYVSQGYNHRVETHVNWVKR